MSGSIVRSTWCGLVYERGVVGQNRYALTFDDGPLPGSTDVILDLLKQRNVPATFFVIGEWAERHPELVRRMFEEGHVVANHTWSHSRLSMMRGPWYWRREIEQTDDVIERIIGRRPMLFRPPMGVRTPINMGAVRRTGHACVLWTRRAMDGVTTTRERIVERLLHEASDGAVLLLHDGKERASTRDPTPTIEALPAVLDGMQARGLEPAPLDKLLGLSAYVE